MYGSSILYTSNNNFLNYFAHFLIHYYVNHEYRSKTKIRKYSDLFLLFLEYGHSYNGYKIDMKFINYLYINDEKIDKNLHVNIAIKYLAEMYYVNEEINLNSYCKIKGELIEFLKSIIKTYDGKNNYKLVNNLKEIIKRLE